MPEQDVSKVALGTAQFGLSYGVANVHGQTTFDEATRIVEESRRLGINTFDTAIAYGESEKVLGDIGVSQFQVITKLSSIPKGTESIRSWIREQLLASFDRLGVRCVDGLLLHRPEQLLGDSGGEIFRELEALKAEGMVRRVGVSIYQPSELEALCSKFKFDLVQCPFSLLDRRLLTSGWLDKLNDSGVSVHARSVFLQGLLLMDRNNRPSKFETWSNLWTLFDEWLSSTNQTALSACLSHVNSVPGIERMVLGVESVSQLIQISKATCSPIHDLPSGLNTEDHMLLNPSNWSCL